MQTRSIQVYQFAELAPKVQAKLVDAEQTYLNECFDADELTANFAERLEAWGYDGYMTGKSAEHVEIRWSLSSCQGDGVAWYGALRTAGLVALAARLMPDQPCPFDLDSLTVEIEGRNNRYHHWNSMRVEVSDNGDDGDGRGDFARLDDGDGSTIRERVTARRNAWIAAFESAISEDVQARSHELEADGYESIRHATSEEEALYQLGERGDWYTADGKRAPEASE